MVNQIEERLRVIQNSIIILKMGKTSENENEVKYKIRELHTEECQLLRELGIK